MKTVGFIPIKLRNQRLPGKNTMDLGGRALCEYVFETAASVTNLDEVYVLCSDVALKPYIPEKLHFLQRPASLDLDTVKSKDIISWFISQVDADIYALMHVTQPFIRRETIETSVAKVIGGEYDSAFAAEAIREFAWYGGKPINYSFENVVRTQELEPIYVETELFVFEKSVFTEHGRRIGFKPYLHPVGWEESVCIDEMQDFELARTVLQMRRQANQN